MDWAWLLCTWVQACNHQPEPNLEQLPAVFGCSIATSLANGSKGFLCQQGECTAYPYGVCWALCLMNPVSSTTPGHSSTWVGRYHGEGCYARGEPILSPKDPLHLELCSEMDGWREIIALYYPEEQ